MLEKLPIRLAAPVLIGLISAQAAFAGSPAPTFVWSDAAGFVPAASCRVSLTKDNPFRIIVSGGQNGASLRSIVGHGRNKKQLNLTINDRSLVVFRASEDEDDGRVQVVGVSGKSAGISNGKLAERSIEGYIAGTELTPLGTAVIALEKGAPKAKINDVRLTDTFWQASVQDDRYVTLTCRKHRGRDDQGQYFAFDVFSSKQIRPIARIGVRIDQTEIFRSINTLTADEAEVIVNDQSNKKRLPPRAASNAARPAFSTMPALQPASSPQQSGSQSSPAMSSAGVTIVVGSPDNVVCISDGGTGVLNEKLSKVIFTAPKGSSVIPAQDFDGQNRKKKKINGETVEFMKAQFPAVSGSNVGWISSRDVTARSQCSFLAQSAAATAAPAPAPVASPNDSQFDTPITAQNTATSTDRSANDNNDAKADFGLGADTCCGFPVNKRPTDSYRTGMRRFRANRGGGTRLHAACDLYREDSEPVVAVTDGEVIRSVYYFYQGVDALEVRHDGGFVVRYGEITGDIADGIRGGARVKRGQTVGFVGTVDSGCCSPMLHFELYSGEATGPLTDRESAGFQRRSDLLNPTEYLSKWEQTEFGAHY